MSKEINVLYAQFVVVVPGKEPTTSRACMLASKDAGLLEQTGRGFMLARNCLLLAASVASSLSLAGESQESRFPSAAGAEKQVINLGRQWAAAEDKADSATLRSILDDRFNATFGSGKTYNKEAYIKAMIGDGVVDATGSQTLTDETVLVDRDTAVVIGTDTARGTDKGEAYTIVYRYTITYIWREGRWRALAEHIARVPKAP